MEANITIADYTDNVNIQSYCNSVYREAIAATLRRLTDAMGDSHHSLGSLGISVDFSKLEEQGLFELQSVGKTVVGQVGVKLIAPGKSGDRVTVYGKIDFWHQPHSLVSPTRVLGFCFDETGRTDVKLIERTASFNSMTLIALLTEVFIRLAKDQVA